MARTFRFEGKMCLPRGASLVVATALLVAGCSGSDAGPAIEGRWRAWLESPGGDLPFGLELVESAQGLEARVLNGSERLVVEHVELEGNRLELGIEPYDSRIVAVFEEGRLRGEWTRTGKRGTQTRLVFHAVADDGPRFPYDGAGPPRQDLSGRWAVDFSEDEHPAVGLFEMHPGGRLEGTFMTATGDYRYLAGRVQGNRLRLSCFDGAHAFLFHAELHPDGILAGDFWSRDTWHETWTARRDAGATLADPFEQTRWSEGVELHELTYPDLDGRPTTLADLQLRGRATILVVFGSWCPNCNDHARDFVELHRRYRDNLTIVGLAFEMTGSFERDTQQVRRYIEHHGIEFPVLLAGTSDKAEATEAFPLIDRVRSFPTTIFLDREGRIRGVHSGYAGPATGDAYRAQQERFEVMIDSLLERDPS